MNYKLNQFDKYERASMREALGKFIVLLRGEYRALGLSAIAIIVTTIANLASPIIIAHIVDTFIVTKNLRGVLVFSAVLMGVYLVGLAANYLQIISMGGVGRRVLFRLRNALFTKLQSLPVAFFNQNKSGDLISRINNDTDKLNQFFSQALMQFVGNFFLILGAGVFLVVLNVRLGLAALIPAAIVLLVTRLLSSWLRTTSTKSLQSLGSLSAEIQESLANFRVIVAFNRLDYFRTRFNRANDANYTASTKAGVASAVLIPIYTTASHVAQLIVLAYGFVLIHSGAATVGLLIAFLLYVNNFYMPLRQLASIWSSFQLSVASLDRINEVMEKETTLLPLGATDSALAAQNTKAHTSDTASKEILAFKNVTFGYSDEKTVLQDVTLSLQRGQTYALVGPTGGGKTTTASLMARLFDPTEGVIELDGKDIRLYSDEERTQKIGFILQEPFLFSGTLKDNIVYGNATYEHASVEAITDALWKLGLDTLLRHFDGGLEMHIGNTDEMSLGQRQIIAFVRALLREPEILILDEATANIDTVTEQVLQDILEKLPARTTRVIIAHRLNTIENAHEIFFVNNGAITPAGSFDHAVELLLHNKRAS